MPRLSVNINDATANALQKIASRREITTTEAIRRAVTIYKLAEDTVVSGGDLLIQKDGKTQRVVLLP